MRILLSLIVYSSLSAAVSGFGSSPCFYPNGTEINSTEYKQCSDGVTTMCCALNRQNPLGSEIDELGWPQEECLSNGLCQSRTRVNGTAQTNWYLEFCTNPDPTSSECLDVCRNTRDAGGGSQMTPCGVSGNDGYNALNDTRKVTRWCCGDTVSCCTNNIDVVELPSNFTGHAVTSSASTSSSTSTAVSATSSGTSSSTPTGNKAPEPGNDGLSTGIKAAIAAGAVVGVVSILLAAFFGRKVYGYRKLVKQREAEGRYASQPHLYGQEPKHVRTDDGPSELFATKVTRPVELPDAGGKTPSELPGWHGGYERE